VNRGNFQMIAGVVEDVIARSSSSVASTIVCDQFGGTIRDTVCLSSGDGAVAVGASTSGGVGTMNLTLRNVTAVATGPNSFGASYRFFGGAGANWIVNARSVIAKGTGKDAVAAAILFGGTCPNTTVSLDFSDYATTQTTNDTGCVAAVSPAGSGSNQMTAPLLDADGFHQLAGSITVDHGFTDGSSGSSDIDGQLRTIGSAPDIGADELAHATSTSLSCLPSSLTLGAGSSTCIVTVTDTASPTPATPTGSVTLSSLGAGSFGPGCAALSPVSSSTANCTVTYTPTGAGASQLTGAYSGDTAHDSSQGSTLLTVKTPPPGGPGPGPGSGPAPGLGATPPPVASKKKCKKKKHKRGATTAKKKCKKKKRR
jgi:hypothetical protein